MFRSCQNPVVWLCCCCSWTAAFLLPVVPGFVLDRIPRHRHRNAATSQKSHGVVVVVVVPRRLRRLYSSNSNSNNEETVPVDRMTISNSTTTTSMTSIQFGDVVPVRRSSQSSSSSSGTIQFGDVVPVRPQRSTTTTITTTTTATSSSPSSSSDVLLTMMMESNRRRNVWVAILSVTLAVSNWLWQLFHPLNPVQLLYTMQQKSQPMTVIGRNHKPTVVDFWAPWCENCKLIAPTLLQVEEEYKDRVNFIMVDGDQISSWPYIEAFGVDAIPHLALVSADGSVETALIGPIPKHVLEADLNVLLENAAAAAAPQSQPQSPEAKKSLPYQMLDVFAGNPQGRTIQFKE